MAYADIVVLHVMAFPPSRTIRVGATVLEELWRRDEIPRQSFVEAAWIYQNDREKAMIVSSPETDWCH